MARPRHPIVLALILGCLASGLTACTQVGEYKSTYSSTSVKPVKGRVDAQQVTFTALAAQRAGLRTATVRASGRETSIPYAALIYDATGRTYTYVSSKPLVYLREPIDIDRIAGDKVLLRHGPLLGTTVVTTGAAEVYSAEFGVEE
jgi:hypothetical protein